MQFLCDVYISYKFKNFLIQQGFLAYHGNEILNKWETTDIDICTFADDNDLIVITKDFDFVDFYHIRKSPKKLIKINLGNISNDILINVFSEILPFIQEIKHRDHSLIEVDKNQFYLVDDKI